ncbi:MAG: hypothetical protein K6A23_01980, partial [Butyrivibrio sp.]|nr:hypothetical protein [Butyrivibrio sp.]
MKKRYFTLIMGLMLLTTACSPATSDSTSENSSESTVAASAESSIDTASEEISKEINTAEIQIIDNELFESLLTESSDTIPEQTSLDELKASATEVSQDLFSGKWQRTNCVTGDFA